MNDREKVIRGLECCLPLTTRCGLGECHDCPYNHVDIPDGWNIGCLHELQSDALALLKAQRPRVMTLEEVEKWEQPDVWIEKKDGEPDLCGDYLMPVTRMGFAFLRSVVIDGSKRPPILYGDYYGKNWRCWTSRPTDEEREATPWGE